MDWFPNSWKTVTGRWLVISLLYKLCPLQNIWEMSSGLEFPWTVKFICPSCPFLPPSSLPENKCIFLRCSKEIHWWVLFLYWSENWSDFSSFHEKSVLEHTTGSVRTIQDGKAALRSCVVPRLMVCGEKGKGMAACLSWVLESQCHLQKHRSEAI